MIFIGQTLAWLFDATNWSGSHGIAVRLWQHLWITFAAVGIAAVIALPTGVLIGHTRRGAGVIGAIVGATRALPTLGLLTMFAIALGVGLRAPLIALVILAIPSLLASAYAGIQAIDPAITGASKAIGFSPSQVIFQVELPLAIPLLIGGLRTATLQVVSTATLAAYTADVGLGRFIFTGLKSHDYSLMLGGAVLVIALALVLEILLATLQRNTSQRLSVSAERK